jgi:hypothetical protein
LASSRQRDYAAEYARRQELAREAGFESAYERRILGGAEAVPGAERPTGAELGIARGHQADVLERDIDKASGGLLEWNPQGGDLSSNDQGNFRGVEVVWHNRDGTSTTRIYRNISYDDLQAILDAAADADITIDANYDLGALIPAGY